MKNIQRGFTLIELMTTVVIVSILASIAIPAYGNYVLRGNLVEAVSALATGQTSMEQYFADNRIYDCAGFTPPSSSNLFGYSCATTNVGNGFILKATGKGQTSGFIYQVDEAGNKSTPSVPSGKSFSTSTTEWVTK